MGFHIPTEWLLGGGWLTSLTALYWGLYSGYLGTGRELKEKNEEIAANRETIRELLSQNGTLVRENETTVKALEALRRVAEGGTAR